MILLLPIYIQKYDTLYSEGRMQEEPVVACKLEAQGRCGLVSLYLCKYENACKTCKKASVK